MLRQLILSHFLFWGWPRSIRKRHKNRQFIKEMRNRAPRTCTPGRARGKVELQFSAAYLRCENWEHQKKQLSGRLMFAAPTRARFWAETSVKAQSKLSSCGISQLFPHEQRSPYPRSTADNCTAGQVSGCWTKSPRLGCCCWTLARFYLWTASI